MREQHWHLSQFELFSRLSPEFLRTLEPHCRAREFPAGSMISLPRDENLPVFILLRGLVKISQFTADGKESILEFVAPGELFGELAMVGQSDQDNYVQAVESSLIVMIPGERIQQLVATNAELALSVTRFVGLRRRRIERRLMTLLFASNRDRLIHLLLDLAEQFGSECAGEVQLGIRLSHQELGNLIGSTRESVTILLRQLKSEDLITTGRRQIIIRQPQLLARSVGRPAPRVSVPPPTPRPLRCAFVAH